MFAVFGAIGKVDPLASYIFQLQPDNTISANRKRTLALENDLRCQINFPVALPFQDRAVLDQLVEILDRASTQELKVDWNYYNLEDTIMASMKVSATEQSIVENECVVLSAQFKEGSTTSFKNSTEVFVALAYASSLSFLTVSNAKLVSSPEHSERISLRMNLNFDEERAKQNRAYALYSALVRIFPANEPFPPPPTKKPRIKKPVPPPSAVKHTVASSQDASAFFRKRSEPITVVLPSIPADTSLEAFFKHLQPPLSMERLDQYVSPIMTAKLHPYQTQNVQWMISRESHTVNDQGLIATNMDRRELPLLYTGIHSDDTSGNYVNMVTRKTLTDRKRMDRLYARSFRGGILADEMGLGKTVSMLGLISKHTYNPADPFHPNPENYPDLIVSKATLIVSPAAIMSQWASEIKRHAPELKVYEYFGASKDDIEPEALADHDIVLVFYETFQSEILHSKPPPPRPRRQAVKYEFKVSLLTRILWFRCVLDEAQMVERSTSKVAKMAKIIPRWYSWAVTGTPMKRDYKDLFGLFNFLKLDDSISESLALFEPLYRNLEYQGLFFEYTKATMRRNTKAHLESQISIPLQTRHVVHLPFTTIEQHYYEDLWRRCKEVLDLDWLDSINWELPQDADEDTKEKYNKIKLQMRSWLVALRQNCVHPSIIGNNQFSLGNQQGQTLNQHKRPQSLTQVLHDMAKAAKDDYDHSQFIFYTKRLKHGGMFELLRRYSDAVDIYRDAIDQVDQLVQFHWKELESMVSLNQRIVSSNTEDEERTKSRISAKTQAYHKWLTLLHQYHFYLAGVYHALELEALETFSYAQAANLRRTLLSKSVAKVELALKELEKAESVIKHTDVYNVGERIIELDLLKFKEYEDEDVHEDDDEDTSIDVMDRGKQRITDMSMLKNVERIGHVLDSQFKKILYLRKKTLDILKRPLLDNDQGKDDVTGEEYEDTLMEQEICQVYISAYQALLQDRKFIVKGTIGVATELIETLDNGEFISDQAKQIEKVEHGFRKSLKSPGFVIESIKDVEPFLKELRKTMQSCSPEYQELNQHQVWLHAQLATQSKLIDDLDSDIRRISLLFNSRIAYYKQLQSISDTLLEWKHKDPVKEIHALIAAEEKWTDLISKNKSKDMYFKVLVEEHRTTLETGQKIRKDCLICQEPLVKGMITYCGHSSCEDCGLRWFKNSRRCHTCNSTVKPEEWYHVSYKEMKMENRDIISKKAHISTDANETEVVVQDDLKELIRVINEQHIKEGQGAKLDAIIRHIKHIKMTDNGKCVVFSQWSKVLEMLRVGLQDNGIQSVTLGGGNKQAIVTQFQEDPNINVILLHARSQSSGLTLVAAQTVFIVEPVINETLEMQAINRIHRIGQTKQTSVFWYIIQDTIEERIQKIHNRKRDRKISSASVADELALSTLSEGGGEYVDDYDLRCCFTRNEIF